MSDIVERLLGYNPPDRTNDDQRQIAQDILDAREEIARLQAAVDAARTQREHHDADCPCVVCLALEALDGEL